MNTPTPRTDAAVIGTNIRSGVFDVVSASFARELERENARLKKKVANLQNVKEALDYYKKYHEDHP